MILIQILGGLGNQLFQYAAARRLALEKGVPLKLDLSGFASYPLRKYKLAHFNIVADIATPDEIAHFTRPHLLGKFTRLLERKLLPPTLRRIYHERQLYVFDPAFLKLRKSLMLQGYFQNIQYFKSVEVTIRHEFTFRTPSNFINEQLARQIQAVNGVSLHIRRGDYASNPATLAFHGLTPLEYYAAAAASVATSVYDPHFFIFSDDLSWVHKNLRLPHPMTFIDHNNADTDYEDLRLMTLCKHHIIANSSFSWWGAWLSSSSRQKVYAPKSWVAGIDVDPQSFSPTNWHFL